MTKKRIRENLYIMLFQTNFHEEGTHLEQAEIYLETLEGEDATNRAKTILKERFCAVLEHLEEIDQRIAQKAEGWSMSRMAKSDLTVLRLAVFELLFDEDVPNKAAINEAVELAKRYGGEKSYRFVNGVLSAIVKELPAQDGE
jgi:N utilization substance protein B